MHFATRATNLHAQNASRLSVPAKLLVAFSLLFSCLALFGQQSESTQKDDQSVTTIKKEVNVVNILATVRNKQGQIVSTLNKEDFKLEVDGKPQTIRYFSRVTDTPLTLGLLVDTSLSQRRLLDKERSASYTFLDELLNESRDKAFIVHFDFEIELLQDLTSSRPKLQAALQKIQAPEPQQMQTSSPYPGQGGGGRGGGTKLYDAIFLACDEITAKQQGRKAVIILSDGVDQGSKVGMGRAIEAAQRSNTLVYTILFADPSAYNNMAGSHPGGHGGGGGGGYPGGGYPGGGYPGGRALSRRRRLPRRGRLSRRRWWLPGWRWRWRQAAAAATRAKTESTSCKCSPNRPADASSRSPSTNPSTISTRPLARNFAISTVWASLPNKPRSRATSTKSTSPPHRKT